MKKIKELSKSDVEFLILLTLLITGFFFVKFFKVNTEYYEYVFLGDSITYRYDLQSYYSNYPVVNSGVGGDRTIDILENLESRVYKYKPDKIIILIGVNDLANGFSDEYVIENIKKIVKDIQDKFPNCTIYLESIYPVNSKWRQYASDKSPSIEDLLRSIKKVNKESKEFCKKNKCIYVDVYSSLEGKNGELNEKYSDDGIHLSDEGYRIATYIIKKNIIK